MFSARARRAWPHGTVLLRPILVFRAREARIRLVTTWHNQTVIFPDGPQSVGANPTTEQRIQELEPMFGEIRLVWNPDSHALLSRAMGYEEGHLFANLEGAQWVAFPPEGALRAGADFYHERFSDGVVVALQSGLPGPARWVRTDHATYSVRGDGYLRIDGATLTGPEHELELPPYRQWSYHDRTPASTRRSILYTYAELALSDFAANVPAALGDLACGNLEWSGSGAVTYRQASGAVRRGNQTAEFEGRELTLNGALASTDAPRRVQEPWGEVYRNEATANGSFDAGADFQPFSIGPSTPPSLDPRIGLLAVLLAAVAAWKWKAIAALFTRILRADPLENPVRALLHDSAHQRPGISLAETVKASGQSYSTVMHHARRLARLGMISMYEFDRRVHLYPPRTPRWHAIQTAPIAGRDGILFVADLVRTGEYQERDVRSALRTRFNRPPYWISRTLGRAERLGVIRRKPTERGWVVCAP